jgi:hypothetical protein
VAKMAGLRGGLELCLFTHRTLSNVAAFARYPVQ